jgi:hypothetical protein
MYVGIPLGAGLFGGLGLYILPIQIQQPISDIVGFFAGWTVCGAFILIGLSFLKGYVLHISFDPAWKSLSIPSWRYYDAKQEIVTGYSGFLFPLFAWQKKIPFSDIVSVLICPQNEAPKYASAYVGTKAEAKFAAYMRFIARTSSEEVAQSTMGMGMGQAVAGAGIAGAAGGAIAAAAAPAIMAVLATYYVLIVQTKDGLLIRDSSTYRQEDFPKFAAVLKAAGVNVL